MAKIKFLGSGSFFVLAKENYHSNIIIESDNGKQLLYDCGTTIPEALNTANINIIDIDTIFISHYHGDHSGGLEYVGFRTYFHSYPLGSNKINLISDKKILKALWKYQLALSMDTFPNIEATLETFFNVKPFIKNNSFSFEELVIKPYSAKHTKDKAYGIYIKGNIEIFITGDTQFTPNRFKKQFRKANIIFHDCEFDTYPNGYHAQFYQLKTLPEEIKAKMYLYHYSIKGKSFEELEKEVLVAGFKGLVKRGFEFNF